MKKAVAVDETVVHTKRLQKLARILETHKNSRSKKKGTKFNMKYWGLHDVSHKPTLKEGFCGTTACALGHAAMDKGFMKAGLELRWFHSAYFKGQLEADVFFGAAFGEFAGEAFFGLSYTEAEDVFLSFNATKAETIAKLKRYAKEREELEVC